MAAPCQGGQLCVVGANGVKLMAVGVRRGHQMCGRDRARASRRAGGSVVARQMVHGEQAQRHGHDPEQQPQPLSGGDDHPDPHHVITVPSIDRKPPKNMHASTIYVGTGTAGTDPLIPSPAVDALLAEAPR